MTGKKYDPLFRIIESKKPPYKTKRVKKICPTCNQNMIEKMIDCNCNELKWINGRGYVHCHYCGNWRGFGASCGCGK